MTLVNNGGGVVKKLWLFFAGVAAASLALAQLSKYKDWGKSAEAYFLTAQEKQEWAAVKSDEEAEKFIAAYWARRDPNPSTAQNEFKDAIERRIAAADEQFKSRRYPKGSLSPRGHIFIVLGLPSRASQSRPGGGDLPAGVTAPGLSTRPEGGSSSSAGGIGGESTAVLVTWTYDKDKFDPSWGIGELKPRFNIDPARGIDDMPRDTAVERAIGIVAEKTVVNPSGNVAAATGAPATGVTGTKPAVPPAATGPGGAPPAAAAAPPPPPAPAAAALPAASRSALEAILKEKKDETSSMFWGGDFNAIPGEGFYALEFDVPADKAAAPLKFGGVVTGENGQEAGSYWEEATLTDMKTGTRTEKGYERSIVLPPGNYRGAFGLFSGEGAPVVSASSTFKIAAKPAEFAVSPLILANTLTPLTKRPGPTDPFVFGMDKPIRIEPKANHLFAKEDSLWYFYTVWNPKLPEQAAAAPTPAPAPPGAPPPAMTPAAAAEAPKPRIQARIGVLKDGQPAFAPMTGPAEMQMLGPAYYATGSEIPLQTFEPGYYTFTLTVRDLNAAKDSAAFKGIERKEDFVVLKPDGSMPEKAAAKPTPATKSKAPAKKG
jgi:GWxTD domain-containing protein